MLIRGSRVRTVTIENSAWNNCFMAFSLAVVGSFTTTTTAAIGTSNKINWMALRAVFQVMPRWVTWRVGKENAW
jgi:hypothetical protein